MNNKNNNENSDEGGDDTETEWTIVQEENEDDNEDMMLLKRDPIEFLGGWMPPRELKIAQQQSKQALQTYIEAANSAAKLLSILNLVESKKES